MNISEQNFLLPVPTGILQIEEESFFCQQVDDNITNAGTSQMSFSLVIPTYNESKNVNVIVQQLSQLLDKTIPGGYELIIVDDDSPDRTWEVAMGLMREYPQLRVMRREGERGLATAVIRGWQAARGEILGVIDGDLQHPPELLLQLWDKIQRGADLAVASRHVEGGGVSEWSIIRRFLSRGAQLLGLIILPGAIGRVSDPMSGYFLVRRRCIAGRSLNPLGYKILIEVLARGKIAWIGEVGYVFQERLAGVSKVTWKQYVDYIQHLLRLRLTNKPINRLLRFGAVVLTRMKEKISGWKLQSMQFHLLLLLLWIVIGTGLRFANLTAKPPWTDEFATMVFSLGNSFKTVPLDKAIALEVLMQPLQPNPAAGASTVIHRLLTEDTHPPLYFVLANWWLNLFAPGRDGYLSLWGARELPALFGVASIPAIYGLGRLAFRSRLVGMLAAAIMAVSPFGIYIAQEARHYSLGILWVIASLGCLVIATRHIQLRNPVPIWVALSWVGINSLGIATHYFFILTLFAETLVLIALGWQQFSGKPSRNPIPFTFYHWWRIVAVAVGTAAGGLVWLTQWQHTPSSGLTNWLYSGERSFLEWINPVFQNFATWLTMLYLLPVEAPTLPVTIASGLVMLIFLIWVLPILYRGIKSQWQQPETKLATGVLGGFVLGAIGIFFAISYGLGFDITRGARYNFVYFPAVIVLLGASLAVCWNASDEKRGRDFPVGAGLEDNLEPKQTTFLQNPPSSNPVTDFDVGAGLEDNLEPKQTTFLQNPPSSNPVTDFDVGAGLEDNLEPKQTTKVQNPPSSNPVTDFDVGAGLEDNLEPKQTTFLQNPPSSNPNGQNFLKTRGKKAVALIWVVGFLSAITVICNLGYRKYYRPDILVPTIQQASSVPVLIATTHNTLTQTGEMMGIAWEWKRAPQIYVNPQFLLAHQEQTLCKGTECRASTILQQTVTQLPQPLDLWLVNFHAPVELEAQKCFADNSEFPHAYGYDYKLYHCR